MSNETLVDAELSDSQLLNEVSEQLTEEKWTRSTIDNYSKKDFVLLDEIIETAEKEGVDKKLRELCLEHLTHSPKSIIALYIAGILTYEQEIIDDSYIFQVITLFKENRKWQVVDYLAEKILTYGENKFALKTLEECYENTNNTDDLLKVWERLAKVDFENGEIPKKLASYHEKEGNEEETIFYYKMALKRFSKSQSMKIIEDLWIILADSIPVELDFFYQIEEEIVKQQPEKSAMLLSLLLPYYQSKNDFDHTIDILKRILQCTPKDKEIGKQLITALKNKYKNHSQLEEYIEKSGLNQDSKEFKIALNTFEKYIVFDRGNYVHHRSWGIGKIAECKGDSLVIDFETKKNHTMSLKIALISLKNLSDDHIWIQKKKNSTALMRDDNEGIKETLISIFKSYNNHAIMKEIKKEMLEIIPASSWTKWWNKAKQVMKTSSSFGNSLTKRDLYFLRDKPLTFEEEAYTNFFSNSQFDNRLSNIIDYLKHSSDIDFEGFQQMLNFFVETANNKSEIDEKTIKSFLLLRKIKRENSKVVFEMKLNPYELLTAKDDLINAYCSLTDNEFRKDILEIIKRNDDDWGTTFLTIMKTAKATKTHNFIIEELIANKKIDEFNEGISYIVDHYRNNPENYFWAAKNLILNPEFLELSNLVLKRLVFNLFHCLDIISKEVSNKKVTQQKRNRKLFTQIVDFLVKEEAFANFIHDMEESDAKKILALINGMAVLDEKNRSQFLTTLLNQFPDFMKEEVETKKEIHSFLVTRQSLERKQRELQHILNVEIPNNSKDIGIAKELGDLRENADYIAALEHQKQLHETASKLTEELNKIKILNIDDVNDNVVSVGTHVELLNLDNNEVESYTILGEWESNMEKGIISYKSPFGCSLLGFKPKESTVFNHGGVKKRYKVKNIKKAEELLAV